MSNKRNGSTTVEQQSRIEWSPSNYRTVITTVGARASIETLAGLYQVAGTPYSITPLEGGDAMVEATYQGEITPTEDPITTEWTFTTRGAVVPIEEHPAVLSAVSSLISTWSGSGESTVYAGLRALKQYLDGEDISGIDSAKVTDIQANATLVAASRKKIAGTTSYLRPEPVLAVIKRYQAGAAFVPNLADVGTVYTNAQLNTALSIPAAYYSEMPSGEWLAEEVEIGWAADGTKVAQQSFRYAVSWDSDLYTHAS